MLALSRSIPGVPRGVDPVVLKRGYRVVQRRDGTGPLMHAGNRLPTPVMVHRGMDRRAFYKRIRAEQRRRAKRYVW